MEIEAESKFIESFIKVNELTSDDFDKWMISPGMLFTAKNSWWGGQGKRTGNHEGLDLVFYKNQKNEIAGFDEYTKIPILYDGVIVGIFNDFLGKSIFIEQGIADHDRGRLCAIFGHVKPMKNVYVGKKCKQGEPIAAVAGMGKSGVRPHLHITIAWVKREITAEVFDWNVIGRSEEITLIDPIEVIGKYSLVSDSEIVGYREGISPSRYATR
jgi:murein DD-endopeptidase MepM/ murein hydrolase activator NlpD